ncbi:MAG TPA: MerR family transcriptional regulator [Gammaproteobacteria bacterium]|nr:MerR family transcriptional regulator [Gammaproteobacteria bacterium]
MSDKPLTIGRLARAAGVSVETVRYYQRLGLIHQPAKPPVGYRTYPAALVQRIRFIKRAQGLGFSLQDIAHLLELGEGHCADVRQQAEAKLAQIEAQIHALQAMGESLKALIRQCAASRDRPACPMVRTLTREEPPSTP